MLGKIKKIGLSRRAVSRDLYFGPYVDRRVAALHIKRKHRNLFLTLTDITGAVVRSISAKFFAANRKKRLAPQVVELITRRLITILKAYRVGYVRLFVRVSRPYLVKAVVRALKAGGIPITFVMDNIAIAHNGCRGKKRRRL